MSAEGTEDPVPDTVSVKETIGEEPSTETPHGNTSPDKETVSSATTVPQSPSSKTGKGDHTLINCCLILKSHLIYF